MSEWKGTKEKWFKNESLSEQNEHGAYQLGTEVSMEQDSDENAACFVVCYDDDPIKLKANFDLIIDAGNTVQKCGLTPSELFDQLCSTQGHNADFVFENDKLKEENAILKRRIEDMEHKRFERMDTDDKISGGRSLSEVCEENEKLKEKVENYKRLYEQACIMITELQNNLTK